MVRLFSNSKCLFLSKVDTSVAVNDNNNNCRVCTVEEEKKSPLSKPEKSCLSCVGPVAGSGSALGHATQASVNEEE